MSATGRVRKLSDNLCQMKSQLLQLRPLEIHISSFRRRPESSVFKGLDTGLRRCDEFLEVPLNRRLLQPPRNTAQRTEENHQVCPGPQPVAAFEFVLSHVADEEQALVMRLDEETGIGFNAHCINAVFSFAPGGQGEAPTWRRVRIEKLRRQPYALGT